MRQYSSKGGPFHGLADALGISRSPGGGGRRGLRLVGLVLIVGIAFGAWVGVKAAALNMPQDYVEVQRAPVRMAGKSPTALASVGAPPMTWTVDIPDLRTVLVDKPLEPVPVTFIEPIVAVIAPKIATTDGPKVPAVFAVPAKARIAIIIDDLGLHEGRAKRIADLPASLTLSWLPYAENIRDQTQYGFERGHQIFAHVPMQPGGDEDPGPNALMSWHGRSEIKSLLDLQLSEFTGLTGINNHMGSKFTSNKMSMTWLMSEVKTRDLLFVDSLTSSKSEAASVAKAYGLPFLQRDFFIDHDAKGNAALVEKRLADLETLAIERGEVIAIGHPYAETLAGLEVWIPAAQARGIEFITVSRMTAAQARVGAMQVAQQDN